LVFLIIIKKVYIGNTNEHVPGETAIEFVSIKEWEKLQKKKRINNVK